MKGLLNQSQDLLDWLESPALKQVRPNPMKKKNLEPVEALVQKQIAKMPMDLLMKARKQKAKYTTVVSGA